MSHERPLILLTNDDGPHSEGLRVLAERLQSLGELFLVVPATEVSACSHHITMHSPLHPSRLPLKGWPGFVVNGTPSDCVKLAILELLTRRPDLILSGINPGSNLGTDILYSGTVAAAGEGALVGIPSIAVSLDCARKRVGPEDFMPAAEFALSVARDLLSHPLPKGTFLNVNVPHGVPGALKPVVTRQGGSGYRESYDKITDPRGRVHYWLAGEMVYETNGPGSDCDAVRSGCISVTPLQYDLTNHEFMKNMEQWPCLEA